MLLLKAVTAAAPEERALYQNGVTVAGIEYPESDYMQSPPQQEFFYAKSTQKVLMASKFAAGMLYDSLVLLYSTIYLWYRHVQYNILLCFQTLEIRMLLLSSQL